MKITMTHEIWLKNWMVLKYLKMKMIRGVVKFQLD
jgi:hypothetical protein